MIQEFYTPLLQMLAFIPLVANTGMGLTPQNEEILCHCLRQSPTKFDAEHF